MQGQVNRNYKNVLKHWVIETYGEESGLTKSGNIRVKVLRELAYHGHPIAISMLKSKRKKQSRKGGLSLIAFKKLPAHEQKKIIDVFLKKKHIKENQIMGGYKGGWSISSLLSNLLRSVVSKEFIDFLDALSGYHTGYRMTDRYEHHYGNGMRPNFFKALMGNYGGYRRYRLNLKKSLIGH